MPLLLAAAARSMDTLLQFRFCVPLLPAPLSLSVVPRSTCCKKRAN